MSITNQDTKIKTSGTGSESTFSFPFKIYNEEDITVQLINKTTGVITAKSLNVDYSVSISSTAEGGTITFLLADPATTVWVFIYSNLAYTQNVVLPVDGAFREISVSNGLDRLCRLIQQVKETADRAVVFRRDAEVIEIEFPEPEADKLLGWNADADALENKEALDADLVAQAEAAKTAAQAAQTAAEAAQLAAEIARDEAEAVAGWTIASQAEAEAGTDNTKVMTPLRTKQAIVANQTILIVNDTKAAGTAGGTFTSGAWRTRVLNTEVLNLITGASLAANQITLPAGTYLITVSSPASGVGEHKIKLCNITDVADTILGSSGYGTTPQYADSNSFIEGYFVIAAPKVFEIQHICNHTQSTNGFGIASNLGVSEVYTQVKIIKIG